MLRSKERGGGVGKEVVIILMQLHYLCLFMLNSSDWIYKANQIHKVNFLISSPNIHRLSSSTRGQENADSVVSIRQGLFFQGQQLRGWSWPCLLTMGNGGYGEGPRRPTHQDQPPNHQGHELSTSIVNGLSLGTTSTRYTTSSSNLFFLWGQGSGWWDSK